MSKSTAAAEAIIALIFNATGWANMADNAASSPVTHLYLALHTADPGAAGDQTTDEVSYTGYARVAVARTSAGWTVSGGVASLIGTAAFPQCNTATGTEATYASVGTASSGTGQILYRGALPSAIPLLAQVVPRITGLTVGEF